MWDFSDTIYFSFGVCSSVAAIVAVADSTELFLVSFLFHATVPRFLLIM